jgi:3',5'-cyclic AMP phosphodiesterase CpdA
MMRSHEYINNDRCLEKVSKLPQPRGGFLFAVVGDIQREVNKLPLIMTSMQKGPPVAFIIQTGDAVVRADSAHYRLFLNELAQCKLSAPLFVVPGNHDIKNDHNNLFETYFGSRNFRFEYGNALFIVIDIARGGWDDEKSDWLRSVLESRNAGILHVFLFMHQLPISGDGSEGHFIDQIDTRLARMLEDYGVDYVFSGHWHENRQKEWRETTFIVNGEDDDFDTHKAGAPFSYNLIRVGEHLIEDQHVELQPGYSTLVFSELHDILIAHLGDFLMKNPWIGLGMALLLAIGVALFLVLWFKLGNAVTS